MSSKYKILLLVFILLLTVLSPVTGASGFQDPMVEIGNITRIKGIRDNQLIGYGIVIGLNGTGDSNRSDATIQSVANMLNNFGVKVSIDGISSGNIAAVMVTANLPPFTSIGDKIDVTISSLGDADSLQGGTLLMTPLQAANGETYAVAQGPISIGGYNISGGGSQARTNHPTVGRIPAGALVEKEIRMDINSEKLDLLLANPDFETAHKIAEVINDELGFGGIARAIDAGDVRVEIPETYQFRPVDFIAEVNNLEVRSNLKARVVIDEKTGTIVFSHNVRISTVAVAHGNLTVTISTTEEVSQPPSFSEGETEKITETEIEVENEEGNIIVVEQKNTIQDLVMALNMIGATPRDIVSIIQKIDAAGALHAELVLI